MRANLADQDVLTVTDTTKRAEPFKEMAASFAATLPDGASRGVRHLAAIDGQAERAMPALA